MNKKIPTKWLHIGVEEIKEEVFQEVKNRYYLNKPKGGIWASPLENRGRFMSHWHEVSYSMGFVEEEHAVVMEFKENAKILVIDSREDLIKATEKYQRKQENKNVLLNEKLLDFERIKEDYDILFLTENGERRTRMSLDMEEPNLSSWDCASCIIMNFNVIEKQSPIVIQKKIEI